MQDQKALAQLEQQVNQILSNSSDSETVLQLISQALGEAFGVDCCLVMVTAENQTTEQIGYWHFESIFMEVPQQQMLTSQGQLAAGKRADSEILVIDDIKGFETTRLIGWRHLPAAVGAVLEIPTCFQGKINGVISLIRSQPYHWSKSEKKRALAVSASVAIAISQVVQTRLLDSLQQQLNTSAQYQALINQLMMAGRHSTELNQILDLAIAATAQTLQVERGLLLMLKYADPLFKTRSRANIPKAKVTVVCEWHNGYCLEVRESQGSAQLPTHSVSTVLDQSFWLSECRLCQQALTNSPLPVVIAGQEDLPVMNLATDVPPLFNLAHFPALLIVPLESQGTVLGFLTLQHSCPRPWKSEELALLEMVSAQVSTAIIQTQTLRQVQSLVEERTAQLQGSLEVQAKLYEKTRQQIDQLRQLNQLKDEFLSTVNHELRTPLTSMSLAIRMLRQQALSTERRAKYLDILDQQCTKEIKLINDLLTLQELESNQARLKLETIDLKTRIHDLAQSFEEQWADKGLTITIDLPEASLLLQTDSKSLERIFQELLTNAGKYSAPDTIVLLRVTHQAQQVNHIVFSLTNIGSGISPKDVTHIFDKFRRGQGVTQQAIQGTGLGLALVKCLVQHLNGTITVASSPVEPSSSWETCFTLTLPQLFAPC